MEPFGLAQVVGNPPQPGLMGAVGQQMLNNFTGGNARNFQAPPESWYNRADPNFTPSIFARPINPPVMESSVGRPEIAKRLMQYAVKNGARFDNFWEDMGALLFTDNKTGSSIIVKYGDLKELPNKLAAMRKEFAK